MSDSKAPTLTRGDNRKYKCDDIATLHSWLEAQGYRFYGQHNPGEYGRFSLQETHDAEEGRSYVHSFIEVFENGDIYSPDPHACEMLDSLSGEAGQERQA